MWVEVLRRWVVVGCVLAPGLLVPGAPAGAGPREAPAAPPVAAERQRAGPGTPGNRPAAEPGPSTGRVRLQWDPGIPGYRLQAREATLEQIASALARETGCEAKVAEPAPSRPLTFSLSARPADRLVRTVARRAGARLSVVHRLERPESGQGFRPGPPAFAGTLLDLDSLRPLPLAEALSLLEEAAEAKCEAEEGVDGRVRVRARGVSLARALDRVAQEVGAVWRTILRFEPVRPVDEGAASRERMLRHFQDLAGLTAPERREELEADLDEADSLPDAEREPFVRRMAEDLLSLGSLLQEVPGEHRAAIAPEILSVARDYQVVLGRMPPARRLRFQPLFGALGSLRLRIGAIR